MAAGSTATGKRAHLTSLQGWLRIAPEDRPKVYAQVYASAEILNLNYWLGIILSAGIATFGLVENSPAVIIGAMLISPLMGPIMAAGLGLAVGDLYLAVKAIVNLLSSVIVAVGLSALLVWVLPFHSATSEILSRTRPNLLDLGIALLSGLAGSVAVAKTSGNDAVMTLPGVAIAVALMPPVCTIGYGLGAGVNTLIMGGAGLLFLTNIVAIVASAFGVFLLIGMNAPELRAEMERSRHDEPMAKKLTQGRLARALSAAGHIQWRILLLVVLVAAVAWPLHKALLQVTSETKVRDTVQEAVAKLLPSGDILSQDLVVGTTSVSIHLITTRTIAAEKIAAAEKEIGERSRHSARITVATVASQNELAQLLQRVNTPPPALPPPPPPTVKSLDQIHAELLARLQPLVAGVWPAAAPLQHFDIAFGQAGVELDAVYVAARPMTPIALDLLTQALRDKLATPDLTLKADRISPAEAARQQAAAAKMTAKAATKAAAR